jgi:DNA-directed RNA polymerase specialized sigma24 family protein
MSNEQIDRASYYPTTHWTQIFQARDLDKTCGRTALGALLSRYRGALLQHLAWKFQGAPDRAEDWLQSFVEKKVLEYRLMEHAEKARGRFRTFLLNALDHFVWDEIKRDQARKRQPAAGFAPLEEAENQSPATTLAWGPDPGDVAWARAVVERAVSETRKWYESQGTPGTWQVFYLGRIQPMLGSGERPSDLQIGQQCGIPADKVSNTLTNATRKFRTELRSVVAEYAAEESEIEEEFHSLIEILRKAA